MRRPLFVLAAVLGAAGCSDHLVEPALERGCSGAPACDAASAGRIKDPASQPRTRVAIPVLEGYVYANAAVDINDRGEVLARNAPGSQVVWSRHGTRQLTLAGGNSGTHAVDLNNRGEAVGTTPVFREWGTEYQVVLWDAQGQGTSLGAFGASQAMARAINDRGAIAGELVYFNDVGYYARTRAFVREPDGTMHVIETPGNAAAADINDRGQVAGSFTDEKGQVRGFVWSEADGLVVLPVIAADPRGTNHVIPYAINERGWVVGFVGTRSDRWFRGFGHAFLWTPEGGMRDLGTLGGQGSSALDVNDRGEVIGRSDIPGGSGSFTWSHEHGMRAMEGPAQSSVTRLNRQGEVVGAVVENGRWQHVIWTHKPKDYE